MKKTFKLQDLDCANCAAKMERAIQQVEGVIWKEVKKKAKKANPDVTILD